MNKKTMKKIHRKAEDILKGWLVSLLPDEEVDINRKNIIYSEDRLCLIDFEPSLLQIKDRVKQWMSTKPYRHHEDIQNNNITAKTDFLGFGCFIKWFLLTDNPPQHYADGCSKVISEFKVHSFPFQNLTRLFVN